MILAELRLAAAQSYAWRSKTGKPITEAEYAAIPDVTAELKRAKTANWRWKPDQRLVEQLVDAEKLVRPLQEVPS